MPLATSFVGRELLENLGPDLLGGVQDAILTTIIDRLRLGDDSKLDEREVVRLLTVADSLKGADIVVRILAMNNHLRRAPGLGGHIARDIRQILFGAYNKKLHIEVVLTLSDDIVWGTANSESHV